MEFNSSAAVFSKKGSFTDSMKRFISEEAAIFSHEDEEAAVASFDKTAEKIVRFSADKNKTKAKQHKVLLDSLKAEGKQGSGKSDLTNNTVTGKAVTDNPVMDKFTDNGNTVKTSGNEKTSSGKTEMTSKEKAAKKEKSKETKKAATKTAVANFLKAKADMSNDIVTDKVTGDALKDGNSGLVKTFTTVINPMTYVKKWLAKLAAIVAPYIAIFTTVAAVVLIIIALLFSILSPIAEVGEALSGFVGMFTGLSLIHI